MGFWGCSNKVNGKTEMLCSMLQASERGSRSRFLAHAAEKAMQDYSALLRDTAFLISLCFRASVLLSVLFVLWLQERPLLLRRPSKLRSTDLSKLSS